MRKQAWFSSNFSYIRAFTNEAGRDVCMYVFNDDTKTIREELAKRERLETQINEFVKRVSDKKKLRSSGVSK